METSKADRIQRIRNLVTHIPVGTVVTYGEITNQVNSTRTKARGEVHRSSKKKRKGTARTFPGGELLIES